MDITILSDAIKNLVPNKPFTVYWQTKEGSIDDLETLKFEDETVINPSNEDIITEYNRLKDIKDTEEQNTEDKKASGKQKLKDLGLDDDEINALIKV